MSPKITMAVALVAIALLLITAAITESLPVLLAAVGGVFAGAGLMGSVFHLRDDR